MKLNKYILIVTALFLFATSNFYAQITIEQMLEVVRNDQIVGGEFHVAIKVKKTGITSANTIGSFTIDFVYDENLLQFDKGIHQAITYLKGYNVFFSDAVSNLIRYGATGGLIYPGAFSGHDVQDSYEIYGIAVFIILDDQVSADIFIEESSNDIGLFDSHANSNNTGVIHDQPLSPPINISNEPLPVELVSFSANYAGNKVGLEWQTATEIDNYGFEIERREAETENAQWRNISFIAGAGNSSNNISYTYFDENLNDDHYFYRLKQIDNDGSYTYSDEVEVKFDLIAEDFTLTQNYPNPFNPSTQIKFGFKEDTQASLKVYNTIGELVSVLFNSKAEAGNLYSVTFNADNLPSGMYIYELRSEKITEVRKMLLLK
jgi:hypothetical protein